MRYHCSVFFVITAVPLGCLAALLSPRWDDLKLMHTWKVVPENWECLGHPHASTTINLRIALRPHRENALIAALYQVSSPRHPRYGAHLSKEQVAELVAPHPHTLELVNSWLEYHGVLSSSISVTHGGNWLTLTGLSVFKANDLLGASYQLYRHAETKETIVRTVGYSLPVALHAHVETVAPTTYFASSRMSWQTPRNRPGGAAAGLVKAASGKPVTALSARDEGDVTPEILRWLYSTVEYVPAATDRNMLGIAGYGGEYASPADLSVFMDHLRWDGADMTFDVVDINYGGWDPDNPGLEGTVDVQYTSAMAYPTPIIYYSTGYGPLGEDDELLAWFEYILDLTDIPQTITTSYANFEKNFPRDHAKRLCDLFALLGARGVSVLYSSGDWGVGQGDCKTPDGDVRFIPTFPPSCPYVTTVGGTMGYEPNPEVAGYYPRVPGSTSGGFSNYFERPEYQDEVVPHFFQDLGNKYQGLYNASGRGTPDISAQAFNVIVVFRGQYLAMEGTSCAAPIAAGVISLLNDYRISQGRPPLGFLNPWLYSTGRDALNDITSGSNPGCNTDGFSAIVGWDPVCPARLVSLHFRCWLTLGL
ncbi:subtilisin-like protein [Lactarius psammicola]|nr:subtilisin-like protein [Lactarius psammicola]